MPEVYKPHRHKDGSINTLICHGDFAPKLNDGRERCKAAVRDHQRWSRVGQCTRAACEDGWCKQHNPGIEAARESAVKARQAAAWLKSRKEFSGPFFYATLKKIADGHNDARALAAEAIKSIRETEESDK